MIRIHCGKPVIRVVDYRTGHAMGAHVWRCANCKQQFVQKTRKAGKGGLFGAPKR